jgi:hypothetical protein
MAEAAREQKDAMPAAGGALSGKTLYCSFCFKSQRQVRTLVSGPAGIFICDECVELCNEVVAGRPRGVAKSSMVLERLSAIDETLQGKSNQLQQVVEILRSREVSWAVVGAGLGISRQSAWERFS